MFNIGGGELLVIALIALIVLGPKRLPEAARQVGKAMGEVRRLSSGFQNELRDAFEETEAASATSPRRDVLASPPQRADTVADAVTAVSEQPSRKKPPARRTPLRAAPVDPSGTNGRATSSAEAAPSPRRAEPATKAPRSRRDRS